MGYGTNPKSNTFLDSTTQTPELAALFSNGLKRCTGPFYSYIFPEASRHTGMDPPHPTLVWRQKSPPPISLDRPLKQSTKRIVMAW